MIYITKIFHFEAAHVLRNHDGHCQNIHGHSYELRVTVKGEPLNDPSSPKNSMVIDFRDLKNIVNECVIDRLDHAFIMSSDMPADFIATTQKHFEKVVIVDYRPTSELMLIDFAERIQKRLPNTVELDRLFLQETNSSFAEWRKE